MRDTSNTQQISHYIIQTQEAELKRIALELHEGVGQTLYSLFTGMQMVENSIEQPELKDYLKEMGHVLEKTINEIRLLAVELHPPTLTTLGLLPAMKSYLKLYTSTYGIEVGVETLGTELPLSEKEKIMLFRACQEALVNIALHADTIRVNIDFIWEADRLCIKIEDFGKGFDVETAMNQSSGLASLIERMALINGSCQITSKFKEGTSIEFTLPL